MERDLKIEDDLLDDTEFDDTEMEEVPEIPEVKKPAPRKKGKSAKAAGLKEFDIRAAHQAWKEKNGIEDDYYY